MEFLELKNITSEILKMSLDGLNGKEKMKM